MSNLLVDVNVKTVMKVEIDAEEAFRILCKSLAMDFVLDEDTDYQIRKDEYGKNGVYVPQYGLYYKLDSRGDLFVALRNVAVNMFPNLYFRNEEYIWNDSKER